jgi:hypothetical protein
MHLVVGNSIVKYWSEELEGRMRVICLPGATLETLMDTARQEVLVSESSVFIQSGIPDLHIKGEPGIVPEKLDLYKGRLLQVHRFVPEAVILLIYPPLNSSQNICATYDDLNALIRSLNNGGTPNTISRIFHRDHEGYFRVESRRLADGIHPRRSETARMVRRVLNFVDNSTEECATPSRGERQLVLQEERRPSNPSTVVSTEGCATSSQGAKQLLQQSDQQTSAAVTVTVEEPVSASARVERLLVQNKEELAELKERYKREKRAIEDNFVAAIQDVLDTRDVSAVRTVSAPGDGRDCATTGSDDLRNRLTRRRPDRKSVV